MGTYFRNLTTSLILAPPLFLTAFCLISLLTSPYTGIRLSLEEKSNIATVDPGSPAERAGIKPGDLIVSVNGLKISYPALVFEPDYIDSRKDLTLFWETQRFLDQTLSQQKEITILIDRGGVQSETILTVTHFPPGKIISRSLESYLINWLMFFIFYLLFRKKRNEITILFMILGTAFVVGDLSAGTYQERDLAFPYLSFRVLDMINYLATFLIYSVLLHLAFVFPRRKKIVNRYPWLLKANYTLAGFWAFMNLLGLFDDPSFMPNFFLSLSKIVFIVMLLFSLLMESNPVYRKQVQWVVFGFFVQTVPRLILFEIPKLYSGVTLVEGDNIIFLLSNLILPASVVISITRYRLMDIDLIFDKVVIYGLVLIVLGGIEWALLSELAEYYVNGIWSLPYAPLLLVLPIVFLYLPLRNGIRKGVQSLFKREPYKVEEEVRRFILSLGVNPGLPALKKFSLFVRERFSPVGISIIGRSPFFSPSEMDRNEQAGRFSIYPIEGDRLEHLPHEIETAGESLWQYLETNRSSAYGYELHDKKILSSSALDSALWVPIFIKSNLVYLVFLMEKWNNTAYSTNDRALLDAISISAGHILESEEMRKGLGEVEERFQKHRDEIMKEIHDGLGSILAHITMASHMLERNYREDEEMSKKMIGIISESSLEATDFLRAGLTILDHPEGKIGEVIPDMKHRLGDMLRAYGIDLEVNMTEDVQEMKIAAHQNLHLFRCLQETVHNVLKHSSATHVTITFCRDPNHLKMTIADNGRGFEVTSQTLQGYGLRNMFQRMEGLGGVFEVLSAPGQGTKLIFAIPVPSPYP